MIHDHYIIIKLQQNLENPRPINKTAPTFNKFFLFQKIKIKSPLKGEKPEKKFQKKKKQNKKKTSEKN